MIHQALLKPRSIVVVGGSNDTQKTGGALLRNLICSGFKGLLYVVNPKEKEVQGIKSYHDMGHLPDVDLAIIAIAARNIPTAVEQLAHQKNTRGFIILSAGFSEESHHGKVMEQQIVATIESVGGSLIGPNCIGVLTPDYTGIFTQPVPKLDPRGCDFISGSGATACFIMESGIPNGLTFSRVFSVGNSAQLGVEEILAYMDESFDPDNFSRVILLYIETISKPYLLLRHAASLVRKGCKIAAIKAGSSEAGSRAASSHTGALTTPDVAVDALFRKAGIVRCYGREDLISVASVFRYPRLKGKNLAVITHAGGPAVMLTDALSAGELAVPKLSGPAAEELLKQLPAGSSVANPIDFLATGNARHLGIIIDYIEHRFDEIDGMAVIFGTPGLNHVFDAYRLLEDKLQSCRKPIYPILPSVLTAREEINDFIAGGRVFFQDEVMFGHALARVYHAPKPEANDPKLPEVDFARIRKTINQSREGYLMPDEISDLLEACNIPRAIHMVVKSPDEATKAALKLGFPLALKVVGHLHKSDVGGVILNVEDNERLLTEFRRMMRIKGTTGIMLQPMLSGTELFIGATFEPKFGHLILCGLGGIFIEVFKDTIAGLSPLSHREALDMIHRLKSYQVIAGTRGQSGVDENLFALIMQRLSALLAAAPEIMELDFNPLMGNKTAITVVDSRIRIARN
jgi:acetyltransferase